MLTTLLRAEALPAASRVRTATKRRPGRGPNRGAEPARGRETGRGRGWGGGAPTPPGTGAQGRVYWGTPGAPPPLTENACTQYESFDSITWRVPSAARSAASGAV